MTKGDNLKQFEPDAPAPLDGVRVLDLSRLVAGNALTHVLADYGADVVKVERAGVGDDLRRWQVNGVSAYWKVYARNKRSVTLNLRDAEGQELLGKLAGRAQILVENFLPGTLENWGIGPEVLWRSNPALIIVRVSGWGQTGPDRDKPGFGSLVEARSGFAAMNGFADRPPVLPPLALADMIAGLYGGVAAMIALRNVEVNGGKGQIVDLPLFDPLLSVLGPQAALFQLTGENPPRTGSQSTTTAPRNTYRCKDGRYVALSASMQSMAERLFRAIDRPDLVDDPRYRTNSDRLRHNDELDAIVGAFMAERTQAENVAHFEAAGVTVGPVLEVGQIADDPMVRARGVIANYPDDELGQIAMHSVAAHLSETPGRMRRPAPDLGQHNAEIYGELGLDDAALRRLAQMEII